MGTGALYPIEFAPGDILIEVGCYKSLAWFGKTRAAAAKIKRSARKVAERWCRQNHIPRSSIATDVWRAEGRDNQVRYIHTITCYRPVKLMVPDFLDPFWADVKAQYLKERYGFAGTGVDSTLEIFYIANERERPSKGSR